MPQLWATCPYQVLYSYVMSEHRNCRLLHQQQQQHNYKNTIITHRQEGAREQQPSLDYNSPSERVII